MNVYNIYIQIILSVISLNLLSAQDSLYLIGTLNGESLDKPIFNVNKAGDINADGYDDYIICIPKSNYCKIYLGSSGFDQESDIILQNPVDIYDFGFFLGDVGDINNDGYDDFIIQGKYDPLYFIGQVHLYLGGETIDTIPEFTFRESFIQDALGSSISGGDVNGDGYNDFIIGNPYNWTNGIGRAYLFWGGESIVDTPYVTFVSDSVGDSFGDFVTCSGDINGDGFNDILVSSPNVNGIPNSASKIFIFYGNTIISNIADTVLFFPSVYSIVHSFYIPDFNGDGIDDFFVTKENKLFFGSESFSANQYVIFSNSEELDSFGETAGSAGDINNDGYDDLIIGATNHKNSAGIMIGGAYVFLGSDQPDTIPDFFIEGETKWSNFGKKVGSLGDINGDGYDEIYILADGYPDYENPLGKIYIYSVKKFIVNVEDEKSKLLQTFDLYQNYPNPFNPSTTIKYEIPKDANVKLSVYNSLGQEVEILVDQNQAMGRYSATFNASNLPTGIYFYRIQASDYVSVKKMSFVK